ncbi:hypothetical protein A1Q1_00459 [Trichosporon asahii var. asahii CBS 2479]|uniref:Uncharacterized protein n=1 Tax=Trichosporon asahii var. asahii (strain ATCC 90039 / CBS 2479 / JCM 2466 / KCTC 7840 / NBRC 103889/ NCYC 2677 / UAMH 7654) TaxID=1186058 RepID=J4UFT9_TRIAS|nr:hypothetical protein A1Q1_00459 [Trichosporon asahii var. asahii CBS 2479]EJT50265.1 hypothetical protein A1Q1_00459 [Trichosporon asahii var. asahii CBS 2479]
MTTTRSKWSVTSVSSDPSSMPPSAAVSRGTPTSQAPSARKVGSRTGHANLPSESEVNDRDGAAGYPAFFSSRWNPDFQQRGGAPR